MVCKAESSRIERRSLEEFRAFLKSYELRNSVEVDLKKVEG